MGSLHYPRVYFNGYHYWNPNTVNNNDYDPPIETYDPPAASLNWDYLGKQTVQSGPLMGKRVTDAETFKAWAEREVAYQGGYAVPGAEWGYFGGQQGGFVTDQAPVIDDPRFSAPAQKTATTGYSTGFDQYGDDPAIEPWVGKAIQVNEDTGSPAKLVDVNPQAFWSSQIFADTFTLGDPSGGFTADLAARMHSRFIGPKGRNYNASNDLVIAAEYGAVFQTCFARDTVAFHGSAGPVRDAIEQAFAAGAAQGLMLRFSAYATLYFQGQAFAHLRPGNRFPLMAALSQLYVKYSKERAEYEAGKLLKEPPRPMSRAYSRVVGWIGLWLPGELASVPGGRFLIPFEQDPVPSSQKKPPIPVAPNNLPTAQYQEPPADAGDDGPVYGAMPLGPATVETEMDGAIAKRFTLDLGSAIPERDSSGTKGDFGRVKFGLRSGTDGAYTYKWISADVPTDQATYEQYGGLVDLDGAGITEADLLEGSFVLQVNSHDSVVPGDAPGTYEPLSAGPYDALVETLATAQTDTRGMYAEQPDAAGPVEQPTPQGNPSQAPTCTLQVRYRGYAPRDYPAAMPTMHLGWQVTSYALASYPAGENPIDLKLSIDGGTSFEDFPAAGVQLPQETDGNIVVQIVANRGSAIPNLAFLPWSSDQRGYRGAPYLPNFKSYYQISGMASSFYAVIRCLPWHDPLANAFDAWLAFAKPGVREVNDAVFQFVFRNYLTAYPVMDFIADPQQFQEWRGRSLALTDPAIFNSASYMPVPRTLSAGQRRIVVSYVKYLEGALADLPLARKEATGQPFEPPPDEPQHPAEVPAATSGPVPLGHG